MTSRAPDYRVGVPGTSRQPAVDPLDDDETHAWLAFLRAATRALEALDRAVADDGLTLADYEILAILSESPDRRLPMTELAHQALVSKSRLTYRVDRLADAGLVTRVRCESDARRVWATLTPTGYRTLQHAWPAHLSSVRRVVVDPVARRDLPAFTRSLQHIVDALDGEADSREPAAPHRG